MRITRFLGAIIRGRSRRWMSGSAATRLAGTISAACVGRTGSFARMRRSGGPVGDVAWGLRCRACEWETSLTAGTVFQDTRKPLRMWFLAMWFVTSQKNGVSALGLQRVLGLGSYETAWTWLHKLRRAMVRPGRDYLTGRSRSMKPTSVAPKRAPGAGKPRPRPLSRWRLKRAVAASAAFAFGASRTCPRPAFFPSSREP